MITAGTLDMPLRTPQQALDHSLAKAHKRLTIGEPAERMDGTRGIVQAIVAEDLAVLVLIELPDGTRIKEQAGYWRGRASL